MHLVNLLGDLLVSSCDRDFPSCNTLLRAFSMFSNSLLSILALILGFGLVVTLSVLPCRSVFTPYSLDFFIIGTSQKYYCPNKKDLFSQVNSTKASYHLWASFRLTRPLNIYRWNAPTYCKSLLSFALSWKAYSYYISAALPAAWAYHSCSSLLPVFLLSPSFNQPIFMDLLCAQHCYNHFRWKSRHNVCFIGLIVTTDILPVFITLWSI